LAIYAINGTQSDRDNIEDEILKHRDNILSAMMPAFRSWLGLRGTKKFWAECPCPGFERHFTYVTESGTLLGFLRKHDPRDLTLPKNPAGLGRRLRSARFRVLKVLEEDSAPQLIQLRRTTNRRPIGFFIADDSGNETDNNDRP